MTGIELTADSCALVDVRSGSRLPQLAAAHIVPPSEWPPQRLGRVRRKKRFSAHANVVAWSADPAALRPLRQAGFTLDAVVTPEQALGLLAAGRDRSETGAATAWIALSRHGAALIVVRGGEILYSRRMEWRYKTVTRLNEQLLQRYTLVSHLAPELQHAIKVVAAQHGARVDGAITCGDLPDLRSLTMPLIEELDLEVETLDSLEGLEVTPDALAGPALEQASALRLAAAVALLPPARAPRGGRWWGRAAAAAMVLALAGWWALVGFPTVARHQAAEQVPPAVPSPAATSGAGTAEPRVVPLIPRAAAQRRAELPPPASEPLPSVTSILFGANRRLAILNGRILGEGDSVGGRRIVRIERETVVLRDPAGREVRVGVRRLKQPPRA